MPIRIWEKNTAPAYILREPCVVATVDEIINLWEIDQVLANNKFAGKHIRISGSMGKVIKENGEYYLTIYASSKYFLRPIHAKLLPEHVADAARYNKGACIYIEGVLQGNEFYDYILIRHAFLANSDIGASAIRQRVLLETEEE